MGGGFALAFEDWRARAREGKNPFGYTIREFVKGSRSAQGAVAAADAEPPKRRARPWKSFKDVEALNEALEDQEFVREWRAVREKEGNLVSVTGTIYPYEPICAGSAGMWRKYWTEMQQVLTERMGPAAPGATGDRTRKVRDWFTQSLFLWGFSMARAPQPGEPRWVGIGSMDEINAIPVALGPAAWDAFGATRFAGQERAWDVRLTGYLERQASADSPAGALRAVFKTLQRDYFLRVPSPQDIEVAGKSVYFSAYIWALFETPQGDNYGLWEHANIADPDLFDEGRTRLTRKARELCGPGDRLAAALAPDVALALEGMP
jgi:hypothetical protein